MEAVFCREVQHIQWVQYNTT